MRWPTHTYSDCVQVAGGSMGTHKLISDQFLSARWCSRTTIAINYRKSKRDPSKEVHRITLYILMIFSSRVINKSHKAAEPAGGIKFIEGSSFEFGIKFCIETVD